VNDKLVDRGTRIILQITGLDFDSAKAKLYEAEKSVKTAIVMEKLNCSLVEAREKLDNANGFLRKVIG
jgi:N-acetylmuramic acid 6-phosphate etherase